MLDSNFWKKYFQVYDILNIVIPYQELMEDLCQALEVKEGDSILDAGSGTGNLSILLTERGADVISLDNVQAGCHLHKSKDPYAKTVCHDLTNKLPFSDNYFDKIVSNNVLYSVQPEKRDFVIKEFCRVLKPGGKVVISNVREGWKPINIYLDHIKKDVKKSGFFKVILKMFKLLRPTIEMFYYNFKIKKASGMKKIRFMLVNEQSELLERNGFKNLNEKLVYAEQGIMNTACKI